VPASACSKAEGEVGAVEAAAAAYIAGVGVKLVVVAGIGPLLARHAKRPGKVCDMATESGAAWRSKIPVIRKKNGKDGSE
jgi:hypothetical protein